MEIGNWKDLKLKTENWKLKIIKKTKIQNWKLIIFKTTNLKKYLKPEIGNSKLEIEALENI